MIKKTIRSIVPDKLLDGITQFRAQARNFCSLAKNYGQYSSIRDGNSVDEMGLPIPWYTYPATEYLSHLDLSTFKVFEYGSGNSTLWWSDRAGHITSVEDDETWYGKIKISLKEKNVSYFLEKSIEKYVSMPNKEFDIFIVDGNHRRECLEHLLNDLGGGIMLIFDNSDWYQDSIKFLQENLGWMQTDFHGFGPINDYTWTTSIFVNPARYAELRYRAHLKSKCGIAKVANVDY